MLAETRQAASLPKSASQVEAAAGISGCSSVVPGNRRSRLRNRILFLLTFCGLIVSASAQSDFNRFNFTAGGGLGIGRHDVANFVGNSYFEVAGGGVNFSRMFGVDAEYMHYDLGFRPSVTRPANLTSPKRKYAVDQPGRHRHRALALWQIGRIRNFRHRFLSAQRFGRSPVDRTALRARVEDGGIPSAMLTATFFRKICPQIPRMPAASTMAEELLTV